MQIMFDSQGDSALELLAVAQALATHRGLKAPDAPAPGAPGVYGDFSAPSKKPSNVVDFLKPSTAASTTVEVPDPPKAEPSSFAAPGSPLEPSSPTATETNTKSSASDPKPTTDWNLLDEFGQPWDSRIHQSGKAKKKTGEWKLQKGIEEKSPGLVEKVVAQIAAERPSVSGSQLPLSEVPPPPPLNDVPPPPSSTLASELSRFGRSPLPEGATEAVKQNEVPPPPASGEVTMTFKALVAKFTEATKAKKITAQEINAMCQSAGAPTLTALNGMAHLVPMVDMALELHLAAQA